MKIEEALLISSIEALTESVKTLIEESRKANEAMLQSEQALVEALTALSGLVKKIDKDNTELEGKGHEQTH